jgi:TPP-dependent pyruvate/acetoin dehydrogenase alpha subunit
MAYSKEDYIKTYDALSFARHYFLAFEELGNKGVLPGFHHLRLGQEGMGAGIYMEIGENDWVMPELGYHPYTALTVGVDKWLLELLGKKGGLNNGFSGEAHWYCPEKRIGPWSGFVGSSAGYVVGLALAMKMDGVDGCVIGMSGDGNLNEGVVSESLNLSAIWKLPIVWVIDNNGIALSTSSKYANAIDDLADRGKGFGIPGSTYDATDIFLVREVMREAIAKARRGEPNCVEFRTNRWLGHFVGDPDLSRDPEAVAAARRDKDPLLHAKAFLTKGDIATAEELDAIDKKHEEDLKEKLLWALKQPDKTAEDVLNSPVFA